MGMSRSDLERLADDTLKGRILLSSTYCERCGYNLRTLPYVYTCPECGNQYNARPLKMKGIFQPHTTRVPVGDVAAGVFSVGGALLFGISGIRSADRTWMDSISTSLGNVLNSCQLFPASSER